MSPIVRILPMLVCAATLFGPVATAQVQQPAAAASSAKKSMSARERVRVQAAFKAATAHPPPPAAAGALTSGTRRSGVVECFNHSGLGMNNKQYFTCTCKNQDCTGFRATCGQYPAYCTELPGQGEGNAACTCDAS